MIGFRQKDFASDQRDCRVHVVAKEDALAYLRTGWTMGRQHRTLSKIRDDAIVSSCP